MEQQVVSNSSTTEADAALYGHVINALRYLTSARQEVTVLYEFEQAKYDGYTQRGKGMEHGQEQARKVESLEWACFEMTNGMGELQGIALERWGRALEVKIVE
jgi:hypothetical protein